ncbi:hypothetical protein KAR91_08035 [Candidatus Pacearchaeota archaeon]|nr:hypothetical protein [Candidatus Pacearchaeota archaeon]
MDFGKFFSSLAGPVLDVVASAIPGGTIALKMINGMLPDDKQLPTNATGKQIKDAVDNDLSGEQRTIIMSKKIDLEMQEVKSWEGIQASMAKADESGSSTRPEIAKMMAWVVVIEILAVILVWGLAVIGKDNATLLILNDSWAMLSALVATPTALLMAYFGMRTKEKQARYSAMTGNPIQTGLAKIIGKLSKG